MLLLLLLPLPLLLDVVVVVFRPSAAASMCAASTSIDRSVLLPHSAYCVDGVCVYVCLLVGGGRGGWVVRVEERGRVRGEVQAGVTVCRGFYTRLADPLKQTVASFFEFKTSDQFPPRTPRLCRGHNCSVKRLGCLFRSGVIMVVQGKQKLSCGLRWQHSCRPQDHSTSPLCLALLKTTARPHHKPLYPDHSTVDD